MTEPCWAEVMMVEREGQPEEKGRRKEVYIHVRLIEANSKLRAEVRLTIPRKTVCSK